MIVGFAKRKSILPPKRNLELIGVSGTICSWNKRISLDGLVNPKRRNIELRYNYDAMLLSTPKNQKKIHNNKIKSELTFPLHNLSFFVKLHCFIRVKLIIGINSFLIFKLPSVSTPQFCKSDEMTCLINDFEMLQAK